MELLERAAQYRVTFTEDLKQDAGNTNRFKDDLRSLKEQGLIAERTVTRLREGAVADVVSVTREGKALLDLLRLDRHLQPDDRGAVLVVRQRRLHERRR